MPPKPPPIQTPHFISTRRRLFSFSFHLLSPSWINFCTGSHATGATFAAAPMPTYFVCRAKEDWFTFYTYQTSVDSSPPAHIFSTRFLSLLYSCAGTSNLPIPSHCNGAHVLNKLISHNCCPRQVHDCDLQQVITTAFMMKTAKSMKTTATERLTTALCDTTQLLASP